MKISFDLDGTLIPRGDDRFPLEKTTSLRRFLAVEPMRLGTRKLFKRLRSLGHSVGIYTTSYRSQRMIRYWLMNYGLKADFIINEEINRKDLFALDIGASKYPPAFDIDLHIDDQPGVALEGEQLGFQTVIVNAEDALSVTILDNNNTVCTN